MESGTDETENQEAEDVPSTPDPSEGDQQPNQPAGPETNEQETNDTNSSNNSGNNQSNGNQTNQDKEKEPDPITEEPESPIDEEERESNFQFSVSRNLTTQQFINEIGSDAQDVAYNNDLYASVMIAQAILRLAQEIVPYPVRQTTISLASRAAFVGKSDLQYARR